MVTTLMSEDNMRVLKQCQNIRLLALVTLIKAVKRTAVCQYLRTPVSLDLIHGSRGSARLIFSFFMNAAQGAIIRNWISNVCKCQPCSFIVGFGNPASPGVKYCSFTDRQTTCVPDSNTYKGLNPDVQPPAPSRKRGLAPYFAGGLYKTERGIDVSFAENLEPGTPIKHARLGSGGVHGLVKKKRDDCDPGDGDEWDSDPVARRERRSPTELVPEFEFIDDVIAYKIR